MRIKSKLYGGFSLIMLVLIIAIVVSVTMLSTLNKNFLETTTTPYTRLRLAERVRLNFTRLDMQRSRLLLADSQTAQRRELEKINNTRERLHFDLEELSNTAYLPDGKKLEAEMKQLYREDLIIELRVAALLESGNRGSELVRLLAKGEALRERIKQSTDSFVAYHEEDITTGLQKMKKRYDFTKNFVVIAGVAGLVLSLLTAAWIIRSILGGLEAFTVALESVRPGLETWPRISIATQDEFFGIARAFNTMSNQLEEDERHQRELLELNNGKDWLKTAFGEFSTMYQGVEDLTTLARLFIQKLTPLVGASCGCMYLKQGTEESAVYRLAGGYARAGEFGQAFHPGEGLVGQCADSQLSMLLSDLPDDYIKVYSGLGEAALQSLILLPVVFEGHTLAIIEIASLRDFSISELALLEQLASNLGVTLHSIAGRERITALLAESQALTEQLQNQAEEVFQQQEELTSAHDQLADHYRQLRQKTDELEKAKTDLEEHTRQLALASRYKSEFLANMSHELRTPLNSLLILAGLLADNKLGNLTEKQVEFAQTICSSGWDLLSLIEDVLDLSKIEAGKMQVDFTTVRVHDVVEFIDKQFRPLAESKGINLWLEVERIPETVFTDQRRLEQILKNLLANAVKFTDQGSVTLTICAEDNRLRFAVTDTGIGIAPDQQHLIFESFRQADGRTSRMYGGTGLGLAISRELATLLGGKIELESKPGIGSTFTLTVPLVFAGSLDEAAATVNSIVISDQADPLQPVEASDILVGRKILIVDDDMRNVFALAALLEDRHMEVVFAQNGREGLEELRQQPNIDLVLMDIMMPEMDGFDALRQIRSLGLNVPVIALTAKAMNTDRECCILAGASDYIIKPVDIGQLLSLMRVWLCP